MTDPSGVKHAVPYDTTAVDMLTARNLWQSIAIVDVVVEELRPTHTLVSIGKVREEAQAGEAHFPHVVFHNDVWYVHEGHEIYLVALVRGDGVMRARVIREDQSRPVDTNPDA